MTEKEIKSEHCDALVNYWDGNYKLPRCCKNRARFLIKLRIKNSEYLFTRKVCSVHKKQICNQIKSGHSSSEIINIESLDKN